MTISVTVTDIHIQAPEQKGAKGYYDFKYRYYQHGSGKPVYGYYSSSFSGRSAEAFRKVLKRGYAARLAIENEL